MARYESEFTLFMKKLKQEQPELEAAQRAGRERLWDKPQDSSMQRAFDEATLSSKRSGY